MTPSVADLQSFEGLEPSLCRPFFSSTIPHRASRPGVEGVEEQRGKVSRVESAARMAASSADELASG